MVFLLSAEFADCTEDRVYGNTGQELPSDSTSFYVVIQIDSFQLDILPPSTGVRFYKDGIIFLSSSKNRRRMVPEHISFGSVQAYYMNLSDSIPGRPVEFSSSASFSYPCEAVTFSKDFQTMFFTKLSKNDDKEKIFKAEYTGNKKSSWLMDKIPLEFCYEGYRYTHPALSADGKIMIFASDMPGTEGGMDLFITRKQEGSWSEPENFSPEINTVGNELFPFLDSADNLFFSSDGLPGYGGYDIFMSRYNGVYWDTTINLSYRINSQHNDVAFTINKEDGKSALFSTKQNFHKSNIQLYRITLGSQNEITDTISFSETLYKEAFLDYDFPPLVITQPVGSVEITPVSPVAVEEFIETEPLEIMEDTFSTLPEKEVISEIIQQPEEKVQLPETEQKPEEVKVIPVLPSPPEKKITAEPPKPVLPSEPEKIITPEVTPTQDAVVYKVQFLSAVKSKGRFQVTVDRENYSASEYFYKGEYRYTAGEFSTLEPARELQFIFRRSGYPDAFVAAFKNGVRSLDRELFRR